MDGKRANLKDSSCNLGPNKRNKPWRGQTKFLQGKRGGHHLFLERDLRSKHKQTMFRVNSQNLAPLKIGFKKRVPGNNLSSQSANRVCKGDLECWAGFLVVCISELLLNFPELSSRIEAFGNPQEFDNYRCM